jgi:glycosyltransferase involved in cell wall biosynthesis
MKSKTKLVKGILFISYDGMHEPLGQSQVLAYLKHLAVDYRIHLISFEKASDLGDKSQHIKISKAIIDANIQWHPLKYHKLPSAIATLWDILCGIILGLCLVWRYQLVIIHARSYVPSLMALVIKLFTGAKYLFDMRGFWADERVDGSLWLRGGLLYRVTKSFERLFLLKANHVVSLTFRAVRIMRNFDYLQGRMPSFTVIPTCADLTRFTPMQQKNSHKHFVLGYVGTVGTWYLFDEAIMCYIQLLQLQPEARFLIVNRGEHTYIRERLAAAGLESSLVEVISATHSEVPKLMSQMNAGIFFIRPAFSKQASAPTKLAEFLGCGIPCLSNSGVGDMAEILEGENVGVAIKDFDIVTIKVALQKMLQLVADPDISRRCVASAQRHFSLDEGVERFRAIYEQMDELNS